MDAGVVSGLLQLATQGRLSRREDFSLEERREQKASHRKRLRRRGAVCGVGAPPRCAPASPSSRLLASDPAALATPPTPFFSNLLEDPGPAGPAKAVPSGNLGRLAFGFLAVCVASGIALTPFYSPARAFDSLERLQGGLPWGFFFRALHAFSGFGLLVATAGHLVQVLAARTERQLSAPSWWRSVLLLPLLVAALLGGFVLRADAEAAAALPVWRHIVESVPLVGAETARLMLGAAIGDLGAVALHHAGTFTLLLWLLTSAHGGRLLPDRRSMILAGLVSAALAGAVPLALSSAPGASPVSAGRLLIGPWYLLGLQGALVDLPVALGWLGPLALVLFLGLLRHARQRVRRLLIVLAAIWFAADLAFTVRLLLLARR